MTEEQIQSRRPGRPKATTTEPAVKKGKPSWKPASVTDVLDKESGFRYRWANKMPDNLAKKEAEGWETVSKLKGDSAKAADDGKIQTGKNLTSIYEKHDLVLQRIPEDVAQERDGYFKEQTARRTMGLTAHLKKEIRTKGGNAPVHGNITISSLKEGEQVIE